MQSGLPCASMPCGRIEPLYVWLVIRHSRSGVPYVNLTLLTSSLRACVLVHHMTLIRNVERVIFD